jgi:DNA repair exonuclease SbcCD nuclease subunit
MGHLTILGSRTTDSEREIHVGGLGAVGAECFSSAFKYVALGHLHRAQTAKGNAAVRYAGSPIPLSFSEAAEDCVARTERGGVVVDQEYLKHFPGESHPECPERIQVLLDLAQDLDRSKFQILAPRAATRAEIDILGVVLAFERGREEPDDMHAGEASITRHFAHKV